MASKSQLKTINEILKIEGMIVTAYQLITEIGCIIYLKNQQSSMACSNCGHLSDKLHQNHWLTVRDLPLGENSVYLKINRRQFKCLNCDRNFSEEFNFVKKRSSFTNRVKQKIAEEIWIGEIISYFDNRTTQGAVEGINNKLKLIKRRGYGFRNFDNFQIRSMLSWHFNI